MARQVVSKSLRLVYEKDGNRRTISVRRFNPDATDEGITTFKNAIAALCGIYLTEVQVSTVESVE